MNQSQKNKDVRKGLSPLFFLSGLVFALSGTLVAFEWQFSSFSTVELPGKSVAFIDTEMHPIRPEEPEKEQSVSVKSEVKPDDLIAITDEPDNIEKEELPDNSKTTDGILDDNPDIIKTGIWDEPDTPDPNTPLIFAEIMPSFGNCHNLKDEDRKAECSNKNIFDYLKMNIEYPEFDRKAGNEGIVYLQFVVDENGKIKDTKTLRGVNSRLDKEALRVLSEMPKWNPGKQGARNVSVVYTLGINFSLK